MDASLNITITRPYFTFFLNNFGNIPNINIGVYRRFVLLLDKIADKNLPGYQPTKIADTAYVKDLSFQHRR